MEKGQILIAIADCFMDDNPDDQALTLGQEYEVIQVSHKEFWIKDDEGDDHEYSLEGYREFFVPKMHQYDNIIHLMKRDIWQRIQLLPKEQTSDVINLEERTINDDGEMYNFVIQDGELYNISLDDNNEAEAESVDYKQLCVEDLIFLLETWEI